MIPRGLDSCYGLIPLFPPPHSHSQYGSSNYYLGRRGYFTVIAPIPDKSDLSPISPNYRIILPYHVGEYLPRSILIILLCIIQATKSHIPLLIIGVSIKPWYILKVFVLNIPDINCYYP